MNNKLLVEFIGTFVFLFVIMFFGKPLHIAVALFLVIYFGGSISGGHFNPAVTVMKYANNDVSSMEAGGYVVVQVLAGLAALGAYKFLAENRMLGL